MVSDQNKTIFIKSQGVPTLRLFSSSPWTVVTSDNVTRSSVQDPGHTLTLGTRVMCDVDPGLLHPVINCLTLTPQYVAATTQPQKLDLNSSPC